jgi:hypothetical protein
MKMPGTWPLVKGIVTGMALVLVPAAAWVGYVSGRATEEIIHARSTEIPCVRSANAERDNGFLPGCSGEGKAGAQAAMMRFNSLGLRGPDYPRQARKGTFRVLLMGSSNVLGLGVPEEQTLARQLEAQLRRRLKRDVEVINGATNGYHTWQSAIHMHELVDHYRPHLVLFNVMSPTCFIFDTAWASRVVFNSAGDPVRIDRSPLGDGITPPWLNAFFFRDAATFYFLHTVHDQLLRLRAAWAARLSRDPLSRLVESTHRAAAYMQKRVQKSGAVFVGFVHGSGESLRGQFVPAPMNFTTVKLMRSLLPPLNFGRREVNAAVRRSDPLILHLREFDFEPMGDDNHIRPDMNSRWAEVLAERLEKEGLLNRALEARR